MINPKLASSKNHIDLTTEKVLYNKFVLDFLQIENAHSVKISPKKLLNSIVEHVNSKGLWKYGEKKIIVIDSILSPLIDSPIKTEHTYANIETTILKNFFNERVKK